MKKKILILVPFLLMLIFAAPVMAAPSMKVDVTADPENTKMSKTEWDKNVVNPGEVGHYEGWKWTGDITLNVPGYDPLIGTFVDYVDGMVFPSITNEPADSVIHKVGEGVYHLHEVWTFPLGTFEGTAQLKQYAPGFAVFESHIVLHGTGAYERWMLVLDGSRESGSAFYEGYVMIK